MTRLKQELAIFKDWVENTLENDRYHQEHKLEVVDNGWSLTTLNRDMETRTTLLEWSSELDMFSVPSSTQYSYHIQKYVRTKWVSIRKASLLPEIPLVNKIKKLQSFLVSECPIPEGFDCLAIDSIRSSAVHVSLFTQEQQGAHTRVTLILPLESQYDHTTWGDFPEDLITCITALWKEINP